MTTPIIEEENLKTKVEDLAAFIGNTPLFPLRNLVQKDSVTIYAKLEWEQLGGSVKARPAYQIIKEAIFNGKLQSGRQLLDASSGNTGIAYATICRSLGIPLTLCMPENASQERKNILNALNINLLYTAGSGTTDEAMQLAQKLQDEHPYHYYYVDQYSNNENIKAHYFGTAEEILSETSHQLTHFVAGLGTTGTFTGTSLRLKEAMNEINLIGLQPDAAMHGLEGWKHLDSAHNPDIFQPNVVDEYEYLATEEVYDMIREVANKEGLLLSPSSAANVLGATKVAEQIEEGMIVTVLPDHLERYGQLSTELFNN